MDQALLLKDNPGQILSYDTTFQLGDFYVSPLIFRNILFKEQPSIPVAFLLHERKFTQTHEELIHVVSEQVPTLQKFQPTIPLVTVGQKAIIAAIKTKFPNIQLVRCWNHLIKDIQHWLKNMVQNT